MVKNDRAAIVLDHYSARGNYGDKFQKYPGTKEAKKWREEDILDLLRSIKNYSRINTKKVILAGWSAGAGIVLPFISHPKKRPCPKVFL